MQKKTFEIGLVMAGAVSAGAYTAGVLDFLLQALNEWEKVKEHSDDKVPPHEVKISVIAGASAGGMTAAILAAMINGDYAPINCLPNREPDQDEIERNKLYNAWVERIDISKLLRDQDLQDSSANVISLLDSTILETIADDAIAFKHSGSRPGYFTDPLNLYLTLTNLNGIPYDIEFKGQTGKGQDLAKHTDYVQFALSDHKPDSEVSEWLNPGDTDHPNWEKLKNVALATGAFPVGLAPRIINRPFAQYNMRFWPVPRQPDSTDSAPLECIKMEHIKPNWPAVLTNEFHFLAVDGGVMDNEPMELARRSLKRNKNSNSRSAGNVDRSLIMIAPFPGVPMERLKKKKELENYNIATVITRLFNSLLEQSRFKPDELLLAQEEDVYNQFLIAPIRRLKDGELAAHPVASGALYGFSGFLSKKFRMHDFQLGRRNCQQFLKRYFALPVEEARSNPVFENYNEGDFNRFSFQKKGKSFLPIIPLFNDANKEILPIQWNTLKVSESDLDKLRNNITKRTKAVSSRLIVKNIEGRFYRIAAKIVVWFKIGDIVNSIMQMIANELEKFKLKA
jgi:hypothetical protein